MYEIKLTKKDIEKMEQEVEHRRLGGAQRSIGRCQRGKGDLAT